MSLRSIRSAIARRFLLKLKRATHRAPPVLITPEATRVLVIAPHMDDEVIPCGGTLLRLIDKGTAVHVMFASDSSGGVVEAQIAEKLREVRRTESTEVSRLMKFAGTIEVGLPDGQLHRYETQLAGAIAEQILRINPDLVFCPFPGDGHSDHMSCSWATANAGVQTGMRSAILAYEVWTALWPNVAVDISSVADRKAEAIRLYASQVEDRDYASSALGLNRFRGQAHAIAHAEAFYQTDARGLLQLTAMLDEF